MKGHSAGELRHSSSAPSLEHPASSLVCNFVFELHLGRYLGGHKPQTDLSFGILTEDIPELALNLLFAPFLVLEDRAPTIDLDISML